MCWPVGTVRLLQERHRTSPDVSIRPEQARHRGGYNKSSRDSRPYFSLSIQGLIGSTHQLRHKIKNPPLSGRIFKQNEKPTL